MPQPERPEVTRVSTSFGIDSVSMVALLIGVGVRGNTLWLIGLAVLAAYLLWWGVISREEGYLERKFGSDYTSYKSQVRRWL